MKQGTTCHGSKAETKKTLGRICLRSCDSVFQFWNKLVSFIGACKTYEDSGITHLLHGNMYEIVCMASQRAMGLWRLNLLLHRRRLCRHTMGHKYLELDKLSG